MLVLYFFGTSKSNVNGTV